MYTGYFLGLTTYDILYEVEHAPAANEKIAALEQVSMAGGPATNAAITFSQLGGASTLISVLGRHPFARLVRDELAAHNVHAVDLAPDEAQIPFSSVSVEKGTGSRSVISVNAVNTQVRRLPEDLYQQNFDILLVDGHQMALSTACCAEAQKRNIPTVLDGGSWKPGTEDLLPHIDYAICSADFAPPGCASTQDVIDFLHRAGVGNVAITRGEKTIIQSVFGQQAEIAVASLKHVRSTLGAGDVFHGAFCYFILKTKGNFSQSLSKASEVAALSCQYLGARKVLSA